MLLPVFQPKKEMPKFCEPFAEYIRPYNLLSQVKPIDAIGVYTCAAMRKVVGKVKTCQVGFSRYSAVLRLLIVIAVVLLLNGGAQGFWDQAKGLSEQKALEACQAWASKGGYWKYRSTDPADSLKGFSMPKRHCSNYKNERAIKGREEQSWYLNAPCHNVSLNCATWDPRRNNPDSHKIIKTWNYR